VDEDDVFVPPILPSSQPPPTVYTDTDELPGRIDEDVFLPWFAPWPAPIGRVFSDTEELPSIAAAFGLDEDVRFPLPISWTIAPPLPTSYPSQGSASVISVDEEYRLQTAATWAAVIAKIFTDDDQLPLQVTTTLDEDVWFAPAVPWPVPTSRVFVDTDEWPTPFGLDEEYWRNLTAPTLAALVPLTQWQTDEYSFLVLVDEDVWRAPAVVWSVAPPRAPFTDTEELPGRVDEDVWLQTFAPWPVPAARLFTDTDELTVVAAFGKDEDTWRATSATYAAPTGRVFTDTDELHSVALPFIADEDLWIAGAAHWAIAMPPAPMRSFSEMEEGIPGGVVVTNVEQILSPRSVLTPPPTVQFYNIPAEFPEDPFQYWARWNLYPWMYGD
jgi:hypothetical protein